MTIIEFIFVIVIILSIGLVIYNIVYKNTKFINVDNITDNTVNNNTNGNLKVNDFNNLPLFNNSNNQKLEQYYLIKQNKKSFDKRKDILTQDIDTENKEIDDFNISYFNFYDQINNTTSNYNNSVDKLHLLNNINDFDTKKNNNKTIREIYNELVN